MGRRRAFVCRRAPVAPAWFQVITKTSARDPLKSDTKPFIENKGWLGASLVAQMVKNLPAMQETWVWPLGQEDHQEKGMAIHYSCLVNSMERGAWRAMVRGITKTWTQLSNWYWHKGRSNRFSNSLDWKVEKLLGRLCLPMKKWYQSGPCGGFLGTKAFLCPTFLCCCCFGCTTQLAGMQRS